MATDRELLIAIEQVAAAYLHRSSWPAQSHDALTHIHIIHELSRRRAVEER